MQKYSWPIGIVTALGAFMTMTALFVHRAFAERVDLVAPDYYYRDKAFSERYASEKRLVARGGAKMSLRDGSVEVNLPVFFSGKEVRGTLFVYSPLNPREDFSLPVVFRGEKKNVTVKLAMHRRWRVSFEFTAAGERYFYEAVFG